MEQGQPQEALLTVNEQVIVMSGHETIRVLEVGVDGDPKTAGEGAGGSPAQGGPPGAEDAPTSTPSSSGGEAAGERPPTLPFPGPPGSPCAPGIPLYPPVSPPPDPPVPPGSPCTPRSLLLRIPLCPRGVSQAGRGGPVGVLAQESLATGVTGVMVPAGTVTQPLLIPISIAGQVTGQQALALVTIPTATLAALPGLTPAAPAGAIFKPFEKLDIPCVPLCVPPECSPKCPLCHPECPHVPYPRSQRHFGHWFCPWATSSLHHHTWTCVHTWTHVQHVWGSVHHTLH
ncbi:PREDICTED: POU domain, class 6, transcription factor 1-like [Ficedula albicollis]|uniref:POU domain, class 6, transcription factor 1-like n=1 Tax=Ficedula albicollis TaxID=59894 RepID=UPI0007AD9295|nr:PREDICTED: POU domain, class 6, transcription factor 1-like [Ficedula albicollis]